MQSYPRIGSSVLTYVNYMSRFVIFCNPGRHTSAPFSLLVEAPGDQFGIRGRQGPLQKARCSRAHDFGVVRLLFVVFGPL